MEHPIRLARSGFTHFDDSIVLESQYELFGGRLWPDSYPNQTPEFMIANRDRGKNDGTCWTIELFRFVRLKTADSISDYQFKLVGKYVHVYTQPIPGGFHFCRVGEQEISPCGRFIIFWTYDPPILISISIPSIVEMDNAVETDAVLDLQAYGTFLFSDDVRPSGKMPVIFMGDQIVVQTTSPYDYLFFEFPSLKFLDKCTEEAGKPRLPRHMQHPQDGFLTPHLWDLLDEQYIASANVSLMSYRSFELARANLMLIDWNGVDPETFILHDAKEDENVWESNHLMSCRGYGWFLWNDAIHVYVAAPGGPDVTNIYIASLKDTIQNAREKVDFSDIAEKWTVHRPFRQCILISSDPLIVMLSQRSTEPIGCLYALKDRGTVEYLGICWKKEDMSNTCMRTDPTFKFMRYHMFEIKSWPPTMRSANVHLFLDRQEGKEYLIRSMKMAVQLKKESSMHIGPQSQLVKNLHRLPVELTAQIFKHITSIKDWLDVAATFPELALYSRETIHRQLLDFLRHQLQTEAACIRPVDNFYEVGCILRLIRFGDVHTWKWLMNTFEMGDDPFTRDVAFAATMADYLHQLNE